jgi:hypothetical protein
MRRKVENQLHCIFVNAITLGFKNFKFNVDEGKEMSNAVRTFPLGLFEVHPTQIGCFIRERVIT